MSLDIVDDLHAAEDRVGTLEHELEKLIGIVVALEEGPVLRTMPAIQRVVNDAMSARTILESRYCRPSCQEHDHDDPSDEEAEDCGCPAHEDESGEASTA